MDAFLCHTWAGDPSLETRWGNISGLDPQQLVHVDGECHLNISEGGVNAGALGYWCEYSIYSELRSQTRSDFFFFSESDKDIYFSVG